MERAKRNFLAFITSYDSKIGNAVARVVQLDIAWSQRSLVLFDGSKGSQTIGRHAIRLPSPLKRLAAACLLFA